MKTYAMLKHPALGAWPGHGMLARLRRAWRDITVNWYQVAVVAMATFATAMDLMFPPVRVAIGQGLDVYAGHAYTPLLAAGTVRVDFTWLALELLVIVAAAIVGWCIGPPTEESTQPRAVRRKAF